MAGVRGPVEDIATRAALPRPASRCGRERARSTLPAAHNAFVYVYEGVANVGEGASSELLRGDLGVTTLGGGKVRVAAPQAAARLIFVAGKPLNEPVAKYGPFVMNTQAQIIEAVEDFRSGRF